MNTEMPSLVLDVHQHVGALDAGGGTVATASLSDEQKGRIELLDSLGFTAAAVMPSLQYMRPEGIADTRRVNNEIARYRDQEIERFPLAFGTSEPLHGERLAREEIVRLSEELQLDGVVWHHRFQGVFADDSRMHALLDECAARGLPALIHLFAESDMESPHALEAIAAAHGDVTFIALDAFTGYEQTAALVQVAKRCPNLYLETAGCVPLTRVLGRVMGEIGSERLIFGTDCYLEPRMWNEPNGLRELQLDPRITDSDRENILWNNALRIFPQLAERLRHVSAPR
jgi:predicted TIM-barrel fold metal-dependent hydrolase